MLNLDAPGSTYPPWTNESRLVFNVNVNQWLIYGRRNGLAGRSAWLARPSSCRHEQWSYVVVEFYPVAE